MAQERNEDGGKGEHSRSMFASTSWVNSTPHPSVLTAEPGQSDVVGGKHTGRLELVSVTWLPPQVTLPAPPPGHSFSHSGEEYFTSFLSSVLRKFLYAYFLLMFFLFENLSDFTFQSRLDLQKSSTERIKFHIPLPLLPNFPY